MPNEEPETEQGNWKDRIKNEFKKEFKKGFEKEFNKKEKESVGQEIGGAIGKEIGQEIGKEVIKPIMKEINQPSDKTTKRIRLIARIVSAPIIIFALIMLTGYTVSWITTGTADPYAIEDYPFIENIPPLLMFLAIVGLGIAWRREKFGGIMNLLFCVLTLIVIPFTMDALDFRSMVPMVLVIIVAIPGVLFVVYWRRLGKITPPNPGG